MSTLPNYKFALREDLKNERHFLPTRAEPKATGWDVRAAMPNKQSLFLRPFEKVKIPLGFRGLCPDGWWYELKPRSSSFVKKDLHALYGTVDETYEGEAIFACQYIPEIILNSMPLVAGTILRSRACDVVEFHNESMFKILQIDFGDAIGQIIPVRREEMDIIEVSNQEYDTLCKNRNAIRGAGGFGSTNKLGK